MQRLSRPVPTPPRRLASVTSTMLIQARLSPSGRTRELACHLPSAPRQPKPRPAPSMKRQSAIFWFQPASTESGHTASHWSAAMTSILAIAHLVVRGLVEGGHVAAEPVGRPFDHLGERHAGRTELLHHAAGIVQPAGRRRLAGELGLLAQKLAELAGQPAYLDRLRTGDVDRRGRRRGVSEA